MNALPSVFPDQAWLPAAPKAVGMDPDSVDRAMDCLREVCGPDGVERTLLIRGGYVIWRGPRVDEVHPIWSCTKSFMSTCLGLLWDDGKVTPDTLAADILPDLKRDYPKVTLEHLATFTAGYRGLEETILKPGPPLHAPGAAFHYSAQSDLLSGLLTLVAGCSLQTLFRERIGDPIGIPEGDFSWGTVGTLKGLEVNGGSGGPPGGIRTNAWVLARIGWLYANQGVWSGTRLISQRYIDYATVSRTSIETPPYDPEAWYISLPGNYGLNWWTNGLLPKGGRRWPSIPDRSFALQGNCNNLALVIPEWSMVLVRAGVDDIIDMGLYDRALSKLASGFTE